MSKKLKIFLFLLSFYLITLSINFNYSAKDNYSDSLFENKQFYNKCHNKTKNFCKIGSQPYDFIFYGSSLMRPIISNIDSEKEKNSFSIISITKDKCFQLYENTNPACEGFSKEAQKIINNNKLAIIVLYYESYEKLLSEIDKIFKLENNFIFIINDIYNELDLTTFLFNEYYLKAKLPQSKNALYSNYDLSFLNKNNFKIIKLSEVFTMLYDDNFILFTDRNHLSLKSGKIILEKIFMVAEEGFEPPTHGL